MNQDFPLALSYDDVLLIPQYSEIDSRSEIDLTTKISPNLTLKIPLISTKMDTVTGVEMAIEMGKLGGMGILPRFESIESQADKVSRVAKAGVPAACAVGVKNGFLERAEILIRAGATVIDIDVAHGHMQKTLEATQMLKNKFGNSITILAGIVATYEAAKDLYESGADSLLVGVGAGSICITRIETGFGLPGFSSLIETSKAARELNKTFMPDAGIRNSGDIVKALGAGASAIVGGFIFAGSEETPGELIEIKEKLFKKYNGSASFAEKTKHTKLIKDEVNSNYVKQVEGVESFVAYKGPLKNVVEKLLAGIRSGLSYGGAKNIPDFWSKAKFVRITPGGLKESNVHDVLTSQ
ncbi:guanosine monophosphate reductase [Candidatus Woesebacteria bacterium]|nr:guanosine monophosphate reductase [Candidatus Woesebacteria bacterium]